MTETAKRELFTRQEEIGTLIEEFPLYIPVTKAAELLHMKPEALRASIEQKRCPFGFCWQLGDRVAYKIPTLTFFSSVRGTALNRSSMRRVRSLYFLYCLVSYAV